MLDSCSFVRTRGDSIQAGDAVRWAKAMPSYLPTQYNYGIIVGIEKSNCFDDQLIFVIGTAVRQVTTVCASYSMAFEVLTRPLVLIDNVVGASR